jgi:aquaporin TIP
MAALIAEFIGTFALIFIGAGSIITAPTGGSAMGTLIGIALAHGLTIAVMGSSVGHISGGHFNPAVTIAMMVTGKMEAPKGIGYIVSQVLGAIVGALLLVACFPKEAVDAAKLGTPLLAANFPVGAAIVLEAITTFFLVFVIFGTAVDARGPKMGALFIGLTVTLDIMAIGPLTGAAMNPARSIGPALVSGHFENFWLYWVGPIIGAVAAGLLYANVLAPKDS